MKIIISESQLNRLFDVISEQVPLGNLIGNASDFGVSTPDFVGLSNPNSIGVSGSSKCKNPKSKRDLIIELFKYAKSTMGQPKQSDLNIQKIVKQLIDVTDPSKTFSKLTKTDFNITNKTKQILSQKTIPQVLSQIKTVQELGSVLNGYQKTTKQYLSSKIGDNISKAVWDVVSKFSKGVIKTMCKDKQKPGTIITSA